MEEYNQEWANYYDDGSEEQRTQRFNFARMIADECMQNDILCTIMSPPDTLTPEARVQKMNGGQFRSKRKNVLRYHTPDGMHGATMSLCCVCNPAAVSPLGSHD